jgi:predicted nucleic acid-binding protein
MHWSEVGNILLKRKRMTPAQGAVLMGGLQRVGLEIADRGLPGVCFALELAARHGLSVYDATYLYLAIDIDGELATLDGDLAKAAVAEGVALAFPLAQPG